jgi:mono/diheme cytochrome c family protein
MPASKQTTATVLLVAGGILLAGLLAVLLSRSALEPYTQVVSTTTTSSINFAVLDHDANLADLERGRVYYVQLCVSCHGVRGDGRGEWAYRVRPVPSDLTGDRVQGRSNDYLFKVISDGLAGTAMRGWKEQLSVAQRRQIVGFLRHLGAQELRDRQIDS